jgi:hypothetical protein
MHEIEVIKIFVSFVITWCIGLIPAIIVRYIILCRPVGKLVAIGTCIIFWITISFILSEALESKGMTNVALTMISFVSYWILRQGKPAKSEQKRNMPTDKKRKPDDKTSGTPVSGANKPSASTNDMAAITQNNPSAITATTKSPLEFERDILNQEFMELYRTGNYDRAQVVGMKAYKVTTKTVGPDHPDVALCLNNLADIYKAVGRYAEAELLYNRSLAIMEKALGSKHPDVAASLNHLAELFYALGRYAEAEPLCNRSLAIMKKTHGPKHPDVATSLENLSALYRATDRQKDAVKLDQRAAAIRAIRQ